MPTYSRDRLPYNLLKKQYLRPGENAYTYFDNLAAWIRAGSATSKNYSVSTTSGGVVQNEFAPTRFQFPAFYVNEGSAGGGPEFRITHTSNFSNTFAPGPTFDSGFLISFWFKLTEFSHADASSSGSNIICITDGTSGQRIVEIFCSESGASLPQVGIRFYDSVSPSTKFVEMKSAFGVDVTKWNHIAFWCDGSSFGNTIKNPDFNFILNGEYPNRAGWQESETFSAAAGTQISTAHASTSVVVKFGNGGGSSVPSSNTVDDSYMNGYIADVAIYNHGVPHLTFSSATANPTDVSLLYRLSLLGAFQEQSGFLNNPERIMRNTLDERSYWPSTVKGGDQRRLGNPSIKWDDAKRPEYTTTQVSYPSLLHRNDSLLTSSIYQTYVDGQLNVPTGARTIPRYAYDMFYEREDEVSLSPFEDSRVYIDRSSNFYLSGSDISGFTGSLAGKDVVVMEFPVQNSITFIKGNYNTTTGDEEHYMAYYNVAEEKLTFQPGARIISNSFPDTNSSFTLKSGQRANAKNFDIARHACFGFTPFPKTISTGSSVTDFNAYPAAYYSGSGSPTEIAGFPSDSRYEPASGSQSFILASDYINAPFLVEKIVISPTQQVADTAGNASSAFLHLYNSGVNPSTTERISEAGASDITLMANYSTIFMMRHYDCPVDDNKTITSVGKIFDYEQPGITGSYAAYIGYQILPYTDRNPSYPNGTIPGASRHSQTNVTGSTNRELVFYANIGFINDLDLTPLHTNANQGLRESIGMENYFDFAVTDGNKDDFLLYLSSSVLIETTPRAIQQSNHLGSIDLGNIKTTTPTGQSARGGWNLRWTGGPTTLSQGFSSRLFENHVATAPEKTVIAVRPADEPIAPVDVEFNVGTQNSTSFLLFPEDKLILGIQGGNINGGMSLRVDPGNIKIQLFGSYVENSRPKLPMLNQSHGYTEAVHGAIGEISIHDQFDISYRQEFSGSNPDTFMGIAEFINPSTVSAAFFPSNVVNFELPNRDRSKPFVVASNATANSHLGIESLNRARAGLASDGTVGDYASLRRNTRVSENGLFDKDSIVFSLPDIWDVDGATGVTNTGTASIFSIGDHAASNTKWAFAFPFEDRYNSVDRVYKRIPGFPLPIISDGSSRPTHTIGSTGGGTGNMIYPKAWFFRDSYSAFDNAADTEDWAAFGMFFGFGSGPRGMHNAIRLTINSLPVDYGDCPRGAKYGLSNWWPTSRSAVFRRTSHGQFRDMLEPRLYGPTLDDTLTQIDDSIVSRVLISNGAVEFLDAADSVIGNKDENYKVKVPFFDIDKVVPTTNPLPPTNNVVTTVIDSL